MKRLTAFALALALVFSTAVGFFACAPRIPKPPEPTAAPVAADSSPILMCTSAPTATLAPTSTVSAEPTPYYSHALDNEPWYQQRHKELFDMLKRNGTYQSDREIEDAIAKMAIDPDKPMVALTFDDGPMPGVTDAILDVLAQYNVRATFFILGWRLKKPESIDLIRRTIAQGCEIGNHTWAHDRMTEQTAGQMTWALSETNRVVFEQTGYVIRDMRPPGGYSNGTVCSVCRKLGLAIVKWAQSGNVMETDPAKIAENVQKQIVNGKELQDGDIILLHDTKEHMIEAVKIIVPQLLDEGYQLVTVWELLQLSPDGYTPGTVYHHR